ncbi:hypothetical protein FHS57_006240 [Runella defluvii]|uniref:Uncharacterized protein n=1 Tax=Runella defluvii TaxID=370973 RepID=A0A7W5ZUW5_9BACT|nr:hypothetical protein [Runella defluvii]MBB3842209.1 hypothetical protein [Runella defluvii]
MAKFVYLPQLKKAINLDCIREVSFYEADDKKCNIVFYDAVSSGNISITVDSIEVGENILKKITRLTDGFNVESEAPAPPEPLDVVFL